MFTRNERMRSIKVSEIVVVLHMKMTALALELDQLAITRGTELHYEGSAASPTGQGKSIAF